jgi:hypothetical protein
MTDNRDVESAPKEGPTAEEVIGGLQRELGAANERALQYSIALTSLLTKLEALAPPAEGKESGKRIKQLEDKVN